MHLFEIFDQEKALVSQIGIRINQLKKDLEDGDIHPQEYTVDELLDYFQATKPDGIILDPDQLYNMIQVPPLKDVIKNIKGDKVVFVGHDEEDTAPAEAPQDEQQKVVANMAKSAMK